MAIKGWLIDKSALVRLAVSPDVELWSERINAGQVFLSSITRLEIGYSTKSAKDFFKTFNSLPLTRMPVEGLSPAIESRAFQVMESLAAKGQHRAPSIPDLLIAATAELSNLSVLHVDKDFEIIKKITQQPTEKLKY